MRILFVENHAVFAETVIKQFLSDHEVQIVASVADAREALAEEGVFDVVLVDYDLDDGKGSEVVLLTRRLGRKPKVVGVSSHEMGNNEMLECGADAICPKLEFDSIGDILKSFE